MRKFYIITNNMKDAELTVTGQISDFLTKNGAQCIVHISSEQEKEGASSYTDADKVPPDVDCVIVLGGDGTLIQAAADMAARDIPLLGVNLGTLGYLAEIERNQVLPAFSRLLSGEYEIEERMMLTGSVVRKDGGAQGHALAMNDVVITRGGRLRIINFNIYVNKKFLNNYSADGVIISTPTGSTGYSLSAGGPIVDPTARLIVITPICPHGMNGRSIVLSAEDEITVELGPGRKTERETAEVTFDGNYHALFATGDKIEVKTSGKSVKIVKLSSTSFVEVLRRKLSN